MRKRHSRPNRQLRHLFIYLLYIYLSKQSTNVAELYPALGLG